MLPRTHLGETTVVVIVYLREWPTILQPLRPAMRDYLFNTLLRGSPDLQDRLDSVLRDVDALHVASRLEDILTELSLTIVNVPLPAEEHVQEGRESPDILSVASMRG